MTNIYSTPEALQGSSSNPCIILSGSNIACNHTEDLPRIRHVELGDDVTIFGLVLIDGPFKAGHRLTIDRSVTATGTFQAGSRAYIQLGCSFYQSMRVGPRSEINHMVTVGKHSSVGEGTRIGKNFVTGAEFSTELGEEGLPVKFGDETHIGSFSTFNTDCEFGYAAKIGNASQFERKVTFGQGATIQRDVVFGHVSTDVSVTFLGHPTIYDNVAFNGAVEFLGMNPPFFRGKVTFCSSNTKITYVPKADRIAGLYTRPYLRTLLDVFVLANIDGSKRTINLYLTRNHNGDMEVLVSAGCFYGPVPDFCARATEEGKHAYTALVTAAAQVLIDKHTLKP